MHPRTRELLDYLDAQRAVLRDAFDDVPSALRDTAPPGRWSAAANVEHLAITEERISGFLRARLDRAIAEGLGRDDATDPILQTLGLEKVLNRETRVNAPDIARPTGLPSADAWAKLETSGVLVRDLARSADGLALGAVTFPHPLFGPLSVYQWFGFIGAHEGRHAAQIRELAAAL